MNIEFGEPAFPSEIQDVSGAIYQCAGMTLRDYFAAKALQGLLADPEMAGCPEDYASMAYAQSDAMLKAREQQS